MKMAFRLTGPICPSRLHNEQASSSAVRQNDPVRGHGPSAVKGHCHLQLVSSASQRPCEALCKSTLWQRGHAAHLPRIPQCGASNAQRGSSSSSSTPSSRITAVQRETAFHLATRPTYLSVFRTSESHPVLSIRGGRGPNRRLFRTCALAKLSSQSAPSTRSSDSRQRDRTSDRKRDGGQAATSKRPEGRRQKQQEERKRGRPKDASPQEQQQQQQQQQQVPQSPLAAMALFSSEEKLLFDPVVPARDAIRCVYAYPNEYTVGICSLGYQLVWAYLASQESVRVSRMFTDAHDPLVRDPELIGFSFSWELDISNLLDMLDSLGVPIRAEDRGGGGGGRRGSCEGEGGKGVEEDVYSMGPIVFGGGAVLSANPEPYADFFDVVLLGDGEELLGNFLASFEAVRGARGVSRLERLKALAMVPGVYVPQLYRVEYDGLLGPVKAVVAVADGVPEVVEKQTFRGKTLAASTVVSRRMAWENIFMLEVVRSCPEMCRFCLASYGSLPFRAQPVEDSLIPALERGLQVTDRIGLLGASVTQHPQFDALLSYLLQPHLSHVRLSISSVRTNTVTAKLAGALAQSGTKSLTIAVESGSERMRAAINKKLDTADIFQAAANAQQGGLEGLKLYSMVGLPGETEEDVDATIELMKGLRRTAPKLALTLGCSTFVPKAHTPYQWQPVRPEAQARMNRLAKAMRAIGVEFRPESYKWSVLQAVLSRGDRRVGRLLEKVREYGGSQGSFGRAFKNMKGVVPPLDFYAFRQISEGECLPWSHLKGSLSPETIRMHAADAAKHWSTPTEVSEV